MKLLALFALTFVAFSEPKPKPPVCDISIQGNVITVPTACLKPWNVQSKHENMIGDLYNVSGTVVLFFDNGHYHALINGQEYMEMRPPQ